MMLIFNTFVVRIIVKKILCSAIHTLAFQYGWKQTVLSDNEIVKCQRHVCLIMKTGNQFGSLGKCTVIEVEPGKCRGGVRPWLPTGKV